MGLEEIIDEVIKNLSRAFNFINFLVSGYIVHRGCGGDIDLDKTLGKQTIGNFVNPDEFNYPFLIFGVPAFVFFTKKLMNPTSDFLESLHSILKPEKAKKEIHKFYGDLDELTDLLAGDYQLIYLKRNNNQVDRKHLLNLLKEANEESKGLPTVGVELEYSCALPIRTIDLLNQSSYFPENQVPKSYSYGGKSEIRTLPTNPYSFYWLIEEFYKHLPKHGASAQICIGDVKRFRMPYIFLAMHFTNQNCFFPMTSPDGNKDGLEFPDRKSVV